MNFHLLASHTVAELLVEAGWGVAGAGDVLLELMNESGVDAISAPLVRAFYLEASTRNAEKYIRYELREVLRGIEQGEKFTEYSIGDGFEGYRLRCRAVQLASDPQVSRHMRRKLRDALQAEASALKFPKLIERAEASRKKGGAR